MKITTFYLVICSLLTCTSTKTAKTLKTQTMHLSGTYSIITLNGETNLISELSLTFNDSTKQVSGYSGCNRFSGSYEVSENSLKLGPLASTRRACMPKYNDIETRMLEALSKINAFSFHEGNLVLKHDSSNLITAKKITTRLLEYSINYSALTRGSYLNYTIEKGKIFTQNQRGAKPVEKFISDEERLLLEKAIQSIDLNSLNELEPPTKAFQYDGALAATLSVTHNGTQYKTPVFDHGSPNAAIKDLVGIVLEIAQRK